jgi:hypothetical protein
MDGQPTHLGVEQLRRGIGALLDTETAVLSGVQLTTLLAEVEAQRRRLDAVDQLLLAEIDRQGLAGEYGRGTTANLLTHLVHVSPGEAQARVARARDLGPRRALTGEPLQPILPATAEAVRAGEISSGHVSVIADCLDAIPAKISHEVSGPAEAFLVEAARNEHPGQLRKTAAMLLARIDPDGIEPREEEVERARGFGLRKYRDGSSTPTGRFTAEVTAMWETVLDSLAAPQSSTDGEPDTRSAEQRRHDAVAEVLSRALRSGTLPASGGVPVTILARTTLAELESGTGIAITSQGTQLSISKLLQMAGDAHILTAVCSVTGGIISYGRKRRLASKGQRLALAARDGGCCFPGCDRPAAWAEVHHIIAWLIGGDTDLANMCLLCRYHHRHFEALGWEVFMQDGMPWWRPPAWLDPDRRPVRNTAHHLDDIQFAPVG